MPTRPQFVISVGIGIALSVSLVALLCRGAGPAPAEISREGARAVGVTGGAQRADLSADESTSIGRQVMVLDPRGEPSPSALLCFYDEPVPHRWRTWTPERSSFVLHSPKGRVRAFSRPASATGELDWWMYEFASRLGEIERDTGRLPKHSTLQLTLRERRGIVGMVPEGLRPSCAGAFEMFALGLDGEHTVERGDICRGGLRVAADPYAGSGVQFHMPDILPGTYLVGLRYPDAVVRDTRVVKVTGALQEVLLGVDEPTDSQRLHVTCTDENGHRLEDVSYRIEWMARGPVNTLHRVNEAISLRTLDRTDALDLRWVPGSGAVAGVVGGTQHEAWLHATSASGGQRVVPLPESVLQLGSLAGESYAPWILSGFVTRNVEIRLTGASASADYEVLAYTERDRRNGVGTVPVRDPVERRSSFRSDPLNPSVQIATVPVRANSSTTLVVRQMNEGIWLAPIEVFSESLQIPAHHITKVLPTSTPLSVPSGAPLRVPVAVPPLRALVVRQVDATVQATAFRLEARMPNTGWRLIMVGHVNHDAPFRTAGLPVGTYRLRAYGTGLRTQFDIGPQSVPLLPVTVDLQLKHQAPKN